MSEQKRHAVIIDERKETFDVAEQRVSKIERNSVCDGKFYATSKLIAVIKAVEANRSEIKDLDMIEVEVDGSLF
jgi:hypothetical protein